MGLISEAIEGGVRGLIEGFRGRGRSRAPRAELAPTNNFFFADPQMPIQPQQALVPAVVPMGEIPSTLHMEFVSSEEDEGYFGVDQPALVMVFSLQDDNEITVGMRLGEELHVDVAPGAYGVIAMVYADEDLDIVDGIGFAVVPVEDWALDVQFELELFEVDEAGADACLEEIDEILESLFA